MSKLYFTQMTDEEIVFLLHEAEKLKNGFFRSQGYVFKPDSENKGVYVLNTPLVKWWEQIPPPEPEPEPEPDETMRTTATSRTRRTTKF